ncbi:guanylate-binding protein 1-like isoform X5 [Chanodichthys erythropterus]|uniref:guanylate-binding protein 1-like isoform X5 n=1 Tax=Chanodichthys erythropterus TaxID=933992 RepID=UPI00351F1D7A
MACGGSMSAPVCLIENDENGKLYVKKQAKDILDGIKEPVVVVSVVGLYRTGKSYIMNRLAGQQSGFALGNTIESKTKGIWMWCVPHPNKKGHTLVLLDTEGLGDVDKGDEKHDTWIFCLAVLLSSTLVYNSLGTIDNTALEKLHYVTELTENIRVKAEVSQDEDESADFMRVFPSFVWAVRDFTLELKKGDDQITSDEYLESALKLKTALGNLAEVYVEAIRSGKVPCLENAVVSLAKIQNVGAVEQALESYMTEMLSMAQLPMDPEDLSNIHKVAEKKATEVFIAMSFNDNDQIYQKELMGKIHNEYQDMCQQNHEASLMQCEEVLREVFDTLEKGISDGLYLKAGGYRQYRNKLAQLTKEYRARTQSQIMCEEVLSTHLKAKEEVGNMILQADQSLSAAEQEKEVQRLKSEVLEQRQRGLEEQNRLQEQAFQDMQRTYDEHVNQIIQQMEREQERMRRDNERVLEAKLKEKETLIEQGFQKEAARMQSEIDSLKADMNKQETSQPSMLSQVVDGIGTAATLFLPGFIPKVAGVALSWLSKRI